MESEEMMEKNEVHNQKIVHRTVIIEWVTILGAVIGCFWILHAQISNLDSKLTIQTQRTDRLYEIYCENQKEFNQRFYEIQQEIKDIYKERRQ